MFVILAFPCLLAVSGCTGGGGGPVPQVLGESADTELEWDDLDAAVKYVAERQELAIVESRTVRVPGEEGGGAQVFRWYKLIDPQDHPVEVRFSTDPGALSGLEGASVSRQGAVVVRYGRFGDDQREQAIVRALLARLDVLAAVD